MQDLVKQPPDEAPPDDEQRKSKLAAAVARNTGAGWRVESRTDYQAIMVKGHRPNHILHLILTVLTLGLWAFVWIAVAGFGGEKRITLNA